MAPTSEAATAQILDFVAFRRRQALRTGVQAGAPRRFFWGWPATGQLTVVEFPALPRSGAPARFRSV